MSYYMNNFYNQKYGRRTENYQDYQKNLNKTNLYHDNIINYFLIISTKNLSL